MDIEGKKRDKPYGLDTKGVIQRDVDLDTILIEEIGQFGRYQLRTLLLCVVLVIFVAWSASEYVFTTARIPARCLIPGCDASEPELYPSWLENAVPREGNSFQTCERYVNISNVYDSTCPAESFDRASTETCGQYVYDNNYSVVYDLDLPCDEWSRSLIGTIRTFGTLTALPLTGFVSDRWGRRLALTINAFNTAWLGIARYWANTYWGFAMSEFIEATLGSGGFSTAYILLMELVGPKFRVAAGATMNSTFAIGQMTMGLIAWAVPHWRNLTLVLYVPQLITLGYFWLMNESVRWLISKGRYSEVKNQLKKIARVNSRELSQQSLIDLKNTAEKSKKIQELEAEERANEPWLPVLVFGYKRVLLRVVVSPIWWITTMLIYYGLSINAVNLSGNRYLNYVAVSFIEIPGYWTAVFLLGLIGRKPVLIGAYWICAACQVAYVFIPSDQFELSLAMFLIGKFTIAMVMTSIYVYTTELFPTRYRHSLFAFASMMGRLGSMLAPLTPALGDTVFEKFPFVLFAGFAFLSGFLVFLTPETLGANMPDTMEEANDLGKNKRTTTS